MKKALLVIGVIAVSWTSAASADVRQGDVRANDVRANDVRQVRTPNPWKTISHGAQPDPFLSRTVKPNPWKSFDVRQAVRPNPFKEWGRVQPNPWKNIRDASWTS